MSGKVRDENVAYLARELYALGVPLVLALVVPDEAAAIQDALAYVRQRADLTLTTGGVGPTHDDITLGAVAQAFGRGLERDSDLKAAIERYYGAAANDEVLSMADMPAGAELLRPTEFFLPIVKVEDVLCFPGDPKALRLLFDAFKGSLGGRPLRLVRVRLDVDEGEVAPLLRTLAESDPEVAIGSYPRFDRDAPYRVLVTLEGPDPSRVESLADRLETQLREELGSTALIGRDAEGPSPPEDSSCPTTRT